MYCSNRNNVVASEMPVLRTSAAVEALQDSMCDACNSLGLQQPVQETDFKDQSYPYFTPEECE